MPRILTALFLAAFSVPGLAHERLIALEGNGAIEVMPELIRIDITVSKQDKRDVAKAKAYVDELSSKAAATLLALGVMEQDITASSLGIHIAYRFDEYGNGTAAGHIASRDIEILVRDIDRYGDLVQALVDVGISEISSVESDISNTRALREQALALAAEDAREKAEFLAKAMGVTLGPVH